MNDSSSSPPVLYLVDDDDDGVDEQNNYFETNTSISQASSSNEMNLPRKKRKLSNANVRVNPSVINWSKRQRNGHYQERLPQNNNMESDLDSEPILLDPNEYIIEEPDSQSYRSFDWTIQPRPSAPLPQPPTLIPNRIITNSIPTTSRVATSNINNNVLKRPIDKPDTNDKFIQQQQQRKSISIPPARPSLALLSLPLPKPTSSLPRPNTQRGRPVKNSRIPTTQSTSPPPSIRQRHEQPTSSNTLTSDIRRQALNGTGIFSAFHDSKYYRCNICKFKSVTSSTLLQHLFTHMFFCDQCSFYTYSYYNLSQHMFEKHNLNLIEEISEPLNPKSFDLLYVTRCPDGTFVLCMDSSSSTKITNNDQQLVISSATHNDQHQNKSPKKKILKQNELLTENDNDVVLLSEENNNNKPRSLTHSKQKEKINQTYVLMKHRKYYKLKKSPCLHSLTLEYNICRENTIRQMCQTQNIFKRRKFLTKYHPTRLIDEVANCLKTIVNDIVNNEDHSDQSSLIYSLPNEILKPILTTDNLNILTNLLKLNNKYDQSIEQNQLYNDEHLARENHEHIYILSAVETNHTEQAIISSLHSSMTNGDSIFTQAKAQKISTTNDNTHRYLKGNNSNTQSPKIQKKQSLPKQIPPRPIISKPLRPLSTHSNDKTNSSISSSKAKAPSVIILD